MSKSTRIQKARKLINRALYRLNLCNLIKTFRLAKNSSAVEYLNVTPITDTTTTASTTGSATANTSTTVITTTSTTTSKQSTLICLNLVCLFSSFIRVSFESCFGLVVLRVVLVWCNPFLSVLVLRVFLVW